MSQSKFAHIWPEQVSPVTISACMSNDAAYYRGEALRFLRWSEKSGNPRMAARWRRLAEDYIALAEQSDAKSTGRAPILHLPMQRQAVQQQQGKLGTDDPTEC